MRRIRKIHLKMIFAFIMFNVVLSLLLAPFIVFWGPFEALKTLAVGSVLTSRHPQFVRAFLSAEQIDKIVSNSKANDTSSGIPGKFPYRKAISQTNRLVRHYVLLLKIRILIVCQSDYNRE